jgi:Ca-activated chloride channel family protein
MGKLAQTSFVTLISTFLLAQSALAHQNPNVASGQYTISDNVDLVLLDASVKDARGRYVTGLSKQDFQVFEDGHPRLVTQFASVDTSVTVGLVVDNSGSMRLKRPEVVLAGLAFAKQSNPNDQFFVINFNNSVYRGLPTQTMFTDKLQTLRAALYYGEPTGQTALYDAVAYALRHLEYSHQEKRTLIVVSDGGDNVSTATFPVLMQLIEASRATIYTVGLYDSQDRDLNPTVLRKMANVSGGEFFEPEKLQDVIPVFTNISKDIRNCYTIGYVPDETNDKRTVRSVRVLARQNGRKLMVHTRTAYSTVPISDLLAKQSKKETDRSSETHE